MNTVIQSALQSLTQDLINRGVQLQNETLEDSVVLSGVWDDERFRIQIFSIRHVKLSAISSAPLIILDTSLDECIVPLDHEESLLLRTIKTSVVELLNRLKDGRGLTLSDVLVGVGEGVASVPTIDIDGVDVNFESMESVASQWSLGEEYGDALDVVANEESIPEVGAEVLEGAGEMMDGAGVMLEGAIEASSSCSIPEFSCCDIDGCT